MIASEGKIIVIPIALIFLIGISAGGTDAVRLAANEGGKLIGGAIAVDPGMGNNQYPAGGIYYHIMSEVNHGANPIPLLFMNSDSTDIQSYMAHYSKKLSNSDIPCCNCCGENQFLIFSSQQAIQISKRVSPL